MRRPFFATSLILMLSAGTALASDPLTLLSAPTDSTKQTVAAETSAVPSLTVTADVKPVVAQPESVTAAPVATVGKPTKLDLAALYYYASQKQDARVKAEFERLRFKFPGFEMPADLYHPAERKLDEAALWSLYAKDDLAGAEAEIARRKAADPAWAPSADFAAKFARKKMRIEIDARHKASDWAGVVAAGAGLDPATEKEVDLLWDMIDAFAGLGDRAELGRYYRALLFRDASHPITKPELITTIQKATRDFPPADIQAVMQRFASDPQVMAGLTGITADLMRRRVADFNADDKQTAALPKADIDALQTAASGKDAKVSDFSLLGWYYLKVKEPAEAGAWFRRALDAEESADHAKGLYLALEQQDRRDEAYELAVKYHEPLSSDPIFLANALAERFSRPDAGGLDAGAVSAFADAILATRSAPHAEILAWYAYNSGQYEAARAWFTKSFDWKPAASSLKGLALATGQLADKPALVALYQKYGTQYPDIWNDVHLNKTPRNRDRRKSVAIDRMQVGAVERDTQSRPAFLDEDARPVRSTTRRVTRNVTTTPDAAPADASAHLGGKRYGACLTALGSSQSPEVALTRGWCLLGLNRTAEAGSAFSAALAGSGKTRADAAYGLAITNLRAGLTGEAESVLSLYPLTPARDSEIRVQIYWQKARSAFDHGDYQQTLNALNARMTLTPEPVDMTELRGWAHLKLGHFSEAKAIFQNLLAYSDSAAARRGLEAASNPAGIANR